MKNKYKVKKIKCNFIFRLLLLILVIFTLNNCELIDNKQSESFISKEESFAYNESKYAPVEGSDEPSGDEATPRSLSTNERTIVYGVKEFENLETLKINGTTNIISIGDIDHDNNDAPIAGNILLKPGLTVTASADSAFTIKVSNNGIKQWRKGNRNGLDQGLMWYKNSSGIYFDSYKESVIVVHGLIFIGGGGSYASDFMGRSNAKRYYLTHGFNTAIFRWEEQSTVGIVKVFGKPFPSEEEPIHILGEAESRMDDNAQRYFTRDLLKAIPDSLNYSKRITLAGHSLGAQLSVYLASDNSIYKNYKFRLILLDTYFSPGYFHDKMDRSISKLGNKTDCGILFVTSSPIGRSAYNLLSSGSKDSMVCVHTDNTSRSDTHGYAVEWFDKTLYDHPDYFVLSGFNYYSSTKNFDSRTSNKNLRKYDGYEYAPFNYWPAWGYVGSGTDSAKVTDDNYLLQ